jgi:hypothetical protein
MDPKSGKGIRDGVVSELAAFFHVKPGHEEQARAACARFADALRAVPQLDTQKTGLRDSRHVLFGDGGLLWATTFETDWDPYLDDAMALIGVDLFIDWMVHTEEATELTAWLESAGGPAALSSSSMEERKKTVAQFGGGLKRIIQSVQAPASGYFNALGGYTVPQVKKAERVEQAFQKVLDDPAAEQALEQPALKPLLDEAAD